mmetsp:Transcript_2340/g.4477  ORF Transcript_2340/g.4477 Transcript_2340/m.4477 type:complete len:792 (+) Transcript_2340:323-2698(+)
MNSLTTVGGIVKNADEAGPPPLPRKPMPKTTRRSRSMNDEIGVGSGGESDFKTSHNDRDLEASNGTYSKDSIAVGPRARNKTLTTIISNSSSAKTPPPITLSPLSTKMSLAADAPTPTTRNPSDNMSTTLSIAPTVTSFDIDVRNPANRFGIAVLEKLFHEESHYYSSPHFVKVFKKGIEAIAKSDNEIHTMEDALALPDITTWMARAIVNEKKTDLRHDRKTERKFDDDTTTTELTTGRAKEEPAKLNFNYNRLSKETTSKAKPSDWKWGDGTMNKRNLNATLENKSLRRATARQQQAQQSNKGHQRSVTSVSTLSAPSLNTTHSILKNINRYIPSKEEATRDKPRELSRKEKAQARVQEYLMQIDMKIQSGKQLKRAHSMGDLHEGRASMRPWDIMENHQLDWNLNRSINSGSKQETDPPFVSRKSAQLHCSAPFDESSSLHVQDSDHDHGVSILVARKREKDIQQYESALREAQKTVQALENTIELLEEASQVKNETIAQLKDNVEELHREIKESGRKSEKLLESEEIIKKLTSALKDKDCSIETLKKQVIDGAQKLAKSEAALCEARNTIAEKEKEMENMRREAEIEQTNLTEKLERYSKEVTSSLESNTQHIEIISKEKDALIDSLKQKIVMLEAGQRVHTVKEGELNEKISTLAIALTEKDKQISKFQEEVFNTHRSKNKSTRSSGKKGKLTKEDGAAIRGDRSRRNASKSTSPSSKSNEVSVVYLEEDEPSRISSLRSERSKRTFVGATIELAHHHKDVVKSPTNRVPISPEFPRGVYESRDDC